MREVAMLRSVFLTSLLLAGCATTEAPGPAGIPYACDGGETARIFYEGGGYYPRATARLLYDGRETDLSAVPPTYGLRYVSAEAEGAPILIWSARGEEAWISQLDPGQSDERAIAHCTRSRY
jgi:hypothetical protein